MEKETIEVITRRVINSRNLETAISEVYKLFRRYLPLDFLNLPIYDSERGTLRYRAFANSQGVILTDETIRLSETARKEAKRIVAKKVELIDSLHENPVTKDVTAHLGLEEPGSSIAAVIDIGSSCFGVLGLAAWGKNRYTPVHLKIIEDLYEYISGAVRHILNQLEIASLKGRLIRENQEIRERLIDGRVIGALAGLKEVMSLAEQSAPLDVPVLIMGETGTGKEVVANSIHRMSKRSDGPMVSINCGAIPDTLLDSELFGHEKGAFTGADAIKIGYFEQAAHGTIFMDEIGELSMQAQVKLLRVMQNMTFQRVGGRMPITVDVRVIAATNRDLTALIANLKFRKDLWFRLNVFPIHVPPLRERIIDIPALAEYFVRKQTIEMNLPYQSRLATGAIERLQAYDWPGNVRELKNVIERELITSRGEQLTFKNLAEIPPEIRECSVSSEPNRYLTLDEMTAQYIHQTLKKTKGKISGMGSASDLLGINPSTLRARMRKLGIQVKKIPQNR